MSSNRLPLLSIAIPAYGRPQELKFGLSRLISQISGKYEDQIEIVVSDDCTPDNRLDEIKDLSGRYSFIKFRRYPENIGLERNLLACAEGCRGEFLWLLGDDDYIETDDGIDQIMTLLSEGAYDFYVLNRTRRNFDLTTLISNNWMNLDADSMRRFGGLREFCLAYGFISVIGFISANIFRREAFANVNAEKYLGTMYPQLGAMVEAFHARPTLLIGRPLICHRTQTAEEKRNVLGKKQLEANFMANTQVRNAIYFSHPFINMLNRLLDKGAFRARDILKIPENTVIKGLLVDFLIQTVDLSQQLGTATKPSIWQHTASFFNRLPLDAERKARVDTLLSAAIPENASDTRAAQSDGRPQPLTISVVSPSFNQAEFLAECLTSVRDQSYRAVEHLVFDPGSTDGSRDVAAGFPHVTLVTEPDSGQSDAVNKGFCAAKGDIIAWINSDDCYIDSTVFERVIKRFMEADAPDIVYGKGIFIDGHGRKLRDVYINKDPSSLHWRFQQEDGILQPALFMRRTVVERVGLLRNDRHFCMDYEYWIRCVKAGIRFAFVDEDFALARYHSSNKTYGMRGKSYSEVCDMLKEHFGYVSYIWLKRYAEFITEGHDGVLANAANAGIKRVAEFEETYRDLMIAYNGTYDAYKVLDERPAEKGYGDTLREMKSLGLGPAVPCKPIPLDRTQEPGHAVYTVGPRRWAFDAGWKASEIAKSHSFLRNLITRPKRETCVIVGNGPSLNKTNLSLLKNADVIISNNAFLSDELISCATYFTVVNYLVAEQSSQHINRLKGVEKVLPYWLSYCLNPGPYTHFMDAVGYPEFSRDMFKNMSWRHTVTFFNLHLAYGLGYRKVVLVGFDHNYKQPKDVVEQDVIQNYEEDENHFHPAYFRGMKWQAADVDMMEEMYKLAKAAFEEDGREIVNCTVGGKLEVFRRAELDHELKGVAGGPAVQSVAVGTMQAHPRLLIVAGTPIGDDSATGRLKESFIGDWPAESLLQVWESGGPSGSLHAIEIGQSIKHSKSQPMAVDSLLARCMKFMPQVIYFNPTDSRKLLDFAKKLAEETDAALVIHMMDDWPARLEAGSEKLIYCDRALRRLISRARQHLSISDAMSEAYEERYGVKWSALANGVEPDKFPVKQMRVERPSAERPFVIRYMGALADDMTYASVSDIARVVASLQQDHSVRFEIYTMHWYKAKAEQDLGGLAGVVVSDLVEPHLYEHSLSEADALVIAYNFDEESIRYIGYSLANKMPECLASGTPVLAYGPRGVATIDYLEYAGLADVVHTRSQSLLGDAIIRLITNADYGRQLAERARSFASANLTRTEVQRKFKEVIMRANSSRGPDAALIGPYERNDTAHYDETSCVAALFSEGGVLSGSTMIDVGAHHGWALTPFVELGWKVYAFEPDNDNRKKLMERLSTMKSSSNVKVDKRAVSDVSRSKLAFFRSDVSTGISGLSAFHPTHESTQTVDTITLDEVLGDENISGISFLKIDTEGHDLFVLKGFPWKRFSPAVIECEFEDSKTVPLGYTFHDLAGFLTSKGYTVYVSEWHPILRYGIRHDWNRLVRYPCELAHDNGWGNLLAFREPINESALVQAVCKTMRDDARQQAKRQAAVAQHVDTTKASSTTVFAMQPGGKRYYVVQAVCFNHVSGNTWRYNHSKSPRYWQACFDTIGDTKRPFIGGMRLTSNRQMTVSVSLARYGSSDYEGVSEKITLIPGVPQWICLRKQFTKLHKTLKMQIEVIQLHEGTEAEFSVEAVYISEVLSGIVSRIKETDLTLRAANRLFRDGDLSTAMLMYLLLYRKTPMKMYASNALMSARKLGIGSIKTIEELTRHAS